MTGIEAAKLCLEGGKVCLQWWSADHYVYHDPKSGHFKVHSWMPEGDIYTFTGTVLVLKKWLPYEEPNQEDRRCGTCDKWKTECQVQLYQARDENSRGCVIWEPISEKQEVCETCGAWNVGGKVVFCEKSLPHSRLKLSNRHTPDFIYCWHQREPKEEPTKPVPEAQEDRRCGTCEAWKRDGTCKEEEPLHRDEFGGSRCVLWSPTPAQTPEPTQFFVVLPENNAHPRFVTPAEAAESLQEKALEYPGQKFFLSRCWEYGVAEEVPVEPDWEKAWENVDECFLRDCESRCFLRDCESRCFLRDCESRYFLRDEVRAILNRHDPRGKKELKVVWKKVKG